MTPCEFCGRESWCSHYGLRMVCGRAACLLAAMRSVLDIGRDRV